MSGIDVETYMDNLRLGEDLPDDFAKTLEGFLLSLCGKALMAQIESNALIAEKGFMGMDYRDPGAVIASAKLQSRIETLRNVQDLILSLTQNEERTHAE